MRADAVRNRQRIFEEARQAVAAGETGLTLNELARRVGVGVGTVYRVFPTQRAMLEAVLEEAVRELVGLAAPAARGADAGESLIGFLSSALRIALERPGLFEVLISGDDETPTLAQAKTELVAAVTGLLEQADPEPALTGENLLKLLCGLIHAISEHPADRQGAAIEAYVRMLRAGLVAGPVG
ncbi:TetR/AcrR family transcriptional regulator [Nocardiopsis mangrovi]|uniref:TetR/AcrR family transcriptional regulator n=1 Tax=Nocardiopsis mangrovi TaxID=1179818 RepID=A0ABV9DWM1_9ACTN